MTSKSKAINLIEPSKRRRKAIPAIEEITFNPSAREDYLTGFHKRKLQRAKRAKEEAAKREREDRITSRKLLRESRKADLEKHVAEVNALLRRANDTYIDEPGREIGTRMEEGTVEASDANLEAEYLDEDRFTTVTVETVEVSRDGLHTAREDEVDGSDGRDVDSNTSRDDFSNGHRESDGKRILEREKPSKPKRRKKQFRYESKAERKVTRYKERSKNNAQARDRKS